MALGLRVFAERTNDNAGQPILDDINGEVLMHTQPDVSIVLGNRPPLSPGTLYISSKQVIWLSDVDRSKGYAVDFISISLHAVSRDPEAYPWPCIYTQIETGDDEDEDEDEEQEQTVDWSSGISKIKEMRLVPADPSHLETLFEVFCECAELNPEPMQEGDEEEHNWIFSADQLNAEGLEEDASTWNTSGNGVLIGHPNGDHDLTHNVLQLHINDQCFEDAEEMEPEHDRDNGRQ